MTQRDRVCIGAVTLLVGLLIVTTGEAMHLEYVTSLGSRHAHPGLSEPPALPVTVEFGLDDTRLVLSRADGTVEAWDTGTRALSPGSDTAPTTWAGLRQQHRPADYHP